MKPNDYQQAAARTEYTPLYVKDSAGEPSLILSQIDHAAKGMNTEQAELDDMLKKHLIYGKPFDDTNVLEECGDLLWYVALALRALKMPMSNLFPMRGQRGTADKLDRITFAVRLMNMAQSDLSRALLDYEDRGVSRDDLFDTTVQAASVCVEAAGIALSACGFTIEQAMETNIAKLKKRYPDKWTSEAALNRDVEAERAVLESAVNESGAK